MNNFKDVIKKRISRRLILTPGVKEIISDISALHDKEIAELKKENSILDSTVREQNYQIECIEEASIKNGEIIAEADTEIIKLKKQISQLKIENEKLRGFCRMYSGRIEMGNKLL